MQRKIQLVKNTGQLCTLVRHLQSIRPSHLRSLVDLSETEFDASVRLLERSRLVRIDDRSIDWIGRVSPS